MNWFISNRADSRTRVIADRHYNRQKIGAKQFVPPGRCLVLITLKADAFWITSFPFARYVKHEWAGAWICSAFRNEGCILSSVLIREAVSCSLWKWGSAPALGMITFIDTTKVKWKRDWGFCYRKAGFVECGKTKGGLIALQLLPESMPIAEPPKGVAPSFNF
jgi:hypothetical protein